MGVANSTTGKTMKIKSKSGELITLTQKIEFGKCTYRLIKEDGKCAVVIAQHDLYNLFNGFLNDKKCKDIKNKKDCK